MTHYPVRIIQISDSHLYADPQKSLLGVNTDESFRTVIQLLQQQEKNIDFIIHSGDLTQDGSESAYIRVAQQLQTLAVPTYCIPGNHDCVEMMNRVYPFARVAMHPKHIVLKNWQLILLNSNIPGKVEGRLAASELTFLQECLEAHTKEHAIIFFHHQPLPIDCAWLDRLGLHNAQEFWRLIANYQQVSTVFFGHIHQEFAHIHQHIQCYATPSTCIQFKRHQQQFGLENLPPGYRFIDLYEDGHLETGIVRAEQYVGFFDEKATGY